MGNSVSTMESQPEGTELELETVSGGVGVLRNGTAKLCFVRMVPGSSPQAFLFGLPLSPSRASCSR